MGLTIDDANSFLRAVNGLAKVELGLTSFEGTEVLYRNERGLDFMLYYTSVLQQKVTFHSISAHQDQWRVFKAEVLTVNHTCK